MYVLQEYDIAISKHYENSEKEIVVLVIEKEDLPYLGDFPAEALLLRGSSSLGTANLRRMKVVFNNEDNNENEKPGSFVLDMPEAVFDIVVDFKEILISELDKGQVVSEHLVPIRLIYNISIKDLV